jgi:hypothetical protein
MECSTVMMLSNTATKPTSLSETQNVSQDAGEFLSRKIWLPKMLYRALPAFYILSGSAALLATLYISEWFWVLPHYLLFSAACLHMGLLVFRRRHKR